MEYASSPEKINLLIKKGSNDIPSNLVDSNYLYLSTIIVIEDIPSSNYTY